MNFQRFFAEIWGERCPIITLKDDVGEFLVLACFKSYDYFSEEKAFLSTL